MTNVLKVLKAATKVLCIVIALTPLQHMLVTAESVPNEISFELSGLEWKKESNTTLTASLKMGDQTMNISLPVSKGSPIIVNWSTASLQPLKFIIELVSQEGIILEINGILNASSLFITSQNYDPLSLIVQKGDLLTIKIYGEFMSFQLELPAKGLTAQAIVNNFPYEPSTKATESMTVYEIRPLPATNNTTFTITLSANGSKVAEAQGCIYNGNITTISLSGILERATGIIQHIVGFSTVTVSTDILQEKDFNPEGTITKALRFMVETVTEIQGSTKVPIRAVDEEGKAVKATFYVTLLKWGFSKTYGPAENISALLFEGEQVEVHAESPGHEPASLTFDVKKDSNIVLLLRSQNPSLISSLTKRLIESIESILSHPLFIPAAIAIIIVILVVIFAAKSRGD